MSTKLSHWYSQEAQNDLMSCNQTIEIFLPKLKTNEAVTSSSFSRNWPNLSHSGESVWNLMFGGCSFFLPEERVHMFKCSKIDISVMKPTDGTRDLTLMSYNSTAL